MTTVRELITKLGFQIDTSALNQANSAVEKTKSNLLVMGAAATAAAYAVAKLFTSFEDKTAEIQHTADELGISTQALQEWQYAARKSGIESERFTKGLERLTRGISEAILNPGDQSKVGQIIGALGVKVYDTNGQLKDMQQILLDVAEGLKNTDNQAILGSASFELFGRGGQRYLSFLRQGSAEIVAKLQEAVDSQNVLSDETIAKGRQQKELVKTLLGTISAVKNTILATVADGINPLLASMQKWIEANQDLIKQNIGEFLEKVGYAASVVGTIIEHLAEGFRYFSSAVGGANNAILIFITVYGLIKLSSTIGAILGLASSMKTLTLFTVGAIGALVKFAFTAIVAAFDAVGEFELSLIKAAKATKVLIATLGAGEIALAPLLILVGGIAIGIGLIGIAVYKFSELMRDVDWESVWDAVKTGFVNFAKYIITIIPALIKSGWEALKDWFSAKLNEIIDGFNNIKADFLAWANYVADYITGKIKSAWNEFKDWMTGTLDDIGQKLDDFKAQGFEKNMKSTLETVGGYLDEYLIKPLDSVGEKFLNIRPGTALKDAGKFLAAPVQALHYLPTAASSYFGGAQQPKFNSSELANSTNNTSNRVNNVQLHTNVTVNVPQGQGGYSSQANSEQAIGAAVAKAIDDHWDRKLEEALWNNPILE